MRDLKDAVGDLPQTTARIVEYIQTAAVAVANLEIEVYGRTSANHFTIDTLDLVLAERIRQDELWGEQSGPPTERLMILLEEVGEIAEEIDFDGDMDPGLLVLEARLLGEKAKAWLESR